GVDFVCAEQEAFIDSSHSRNELFLSSVEAFVPSLTSEMSVSRLVAFRADTALQRQRFRHVLEVEISRFEIITSESDFVAALRDVKEILREQLALLEVRCRQHRLEIVKQTFVL